MEAKKRRGKTGKAASFVVRAGSVEIPVYFRTIAKKGVEYPNFTVVHYNASGKRVQRAFSTEAKARKEAETIAASLSRGQAEAVNFTAADAEKYGRAVALLRSLSIPLLAAVEEYVDAKAALPPGVSLKAAALDAATRAQTTDKRPVREIVAELIGDREKDGASEVHLRDLRYRLKRFSEAFDCPLGSVTAPLVREFLGSLKTDEDKPVSNRTRRNVLRIISGLYLFAGKRRYVPAELVQDIRGIEAPKAKTEEAGIWTPGEMRSLLAAAKDYLVPALAIGGFAGLRTAEIARLDWQDVRLGEGVIILTATKTKTAARRVVPIQPNLAEWLKPRARASGPVSPASTANTLAIQFSRTGERAGLEWVPNALRHSFCSYRLAVTHDPARVATEAGNSPAMVHRHYKSLVTEAQGKEWFGIAPGRSIEAPIITMPMAATG